MMFVVTACGLLVPQYIQKIIDDGIYPKQIEVIQSVAISLIVITIIKAIANFFQIFWSQSASQGIAFDLRNQLFKKLEYLEFSFHDKHHIGQLLTRATNDVEALRNFFATGLLQIIAALLTFIGSVVILLNTEWRLFLLVSIVLPIIIVIFFYMFRKLNPIFGSIQQNKGILNNILQENILGIRVVKGFTAEPLEQNRYEGQNQRIYSDNLKMISVFSNGFPVVFFLSNVATVIVLFFGGRQVMNDQLSIGTLVAFNSYLTFLVQPIFQLGFIVQEYARATASGNRVFSILDTQRQIKTSGHSVVFTDETTPSIEFKDVSFSYFDSEDELSVKHINLTIEAGSNTAIIGKTGSGKSTLVSLIPRYYDATSGSVLIDGIDVKNYNLESLRQHVGVVLQEIRLLNGTIRENIKYGKPAATDEQVLEVCKIAQVDAFLSKIPEGLDFEVGEGGKNLSGGQRQRIAIARMLLVEPRILILDDATSALDVQTESELIQDAQPYLNSELHTVIVISQKMETIRKANRIIVMKNGEIVGDGSHEYLLRCSPDYVELLNASNHEPEHA